MLERSVLHTLQVLGMGCWWGRMVVMRVLHLLRGFLSLWIARSVRDVVVSDRFCLSLRSSNGRGRCV